MFRRGQREPCLLWGQGSYQRVEKFLPTSEPKIDIAVILAVIHSEKIMHSSENFFKEFDYVRTRMLLFWLYIRRY